jgi:hypothetical protein
MAKRTLAALRIESYCGEDSYLHCGPLDSMPATLLDEPSPENFLYAIVAIDESHHAEILDCGYRSLDEALHYWPEAKTSEVSHVEQDRSKVESR